MMRLTHKRGVALVTGALALTGMLVAPLSASATPQNGVLPAHDGVAHCAVETGDLYWGVKSSFREYITGSIANGNWDPRDGAEYIPAQFDANGVAPLTDVFKWSPATGEVDSDLTSGSIDYTGEVFFEGHSGALQLTVTNPSLEFEGDNGYLVLTMGDSDGAGPQRVRAAKLDLSGAVSVSETEITVTNAPVRLTAEGAAGLNGTKGYGTYTAGQEMDPLTVEAQVSDCAAGAVASETTEAKAGDTEDQTSSEEASNTEAGASVSVPAIVVGGVALIVIIGAAIMLIRGRKTTPKRDENTTEENGE